MADGVKLRHFLEYDSNTWQELGKHSDKRYNIDSHQRKFFPWTYPLIEIGAKILIGAFEIDPKVRLTADEYSHQFTERYCLEDPKINERNAYFVLGRLSAVTFVYEGVDEHAVDVTASPDGVQTFLLTNGGYYFCKKLLQNERDSRNPSFKIWPYHVGMAIGMSEK